MASNLAIETNYRRPAAMARYRISATLVAIAMIVVTTGMLLWSSRDTGFLDCSMECGETLLAVRSAELYRDEGVHFGLLENMGSLTAPAIYTHNVNIGGYLLIAAQILGIPSRYYLIVPALISSIALYYVFLTFRYFTRNDLAALIAVAVFGSTYWGLGAFGLNALRAWHMLAFFAVFMHTAQVLADPKSKWAIGGLIFGAVAAFGCGYDFWLICGATSAMIILFSLDAGWRPKIWATLLVAAAFAAPFILRQIQVAYALGAAYWAQDFIYTVAIKVPYADQLIKIPPLEEIDAYYRSQHVMRPPAQPGNTAWQIFFTFRHMVEFVTIPRWGLVTIGLTGVCFLASLLPVFRRTLLVAQSYRIVLPMIVGPTLGLIALSPFALHVYFKHEFPLIAFPLLAAKALIIYVLIKTVLENRNKALRALSSVLVLVIGGDAAMVHWNNTKHSEYPTFAWAPFHRAHNPDDIAMSTYQLMGNGAQYLKANQQPNANFTQSQLVAGEEPTRPFWIYQPVDYMTDFDRTMPTCRWTGWLRQILDKPFPHKPGISCVYDQVFIPTATPAPKSLDEVASNLKNYEVIDRSDLGIGHLIMKRKADAPQ